MTAYVEANIRGILDNCAKLVGEHPELAASIFVECCHSHEGVVSTEQMEALYRESLGKLET